MRLVNEKGKLFGIVNPVDLMIFIVIIVIISAIGVRLFSKQVNEAVSPNVKLTAEIVVIGTPPRIIKEIERQNLVGERLVSGNEFMDAKITKVTIEPYIMQAVTSDGKVVDAQDPSKKDIVFEIETMVPKGTPSPKMGSQELRAGKTFILKTQAFESIGTIRYVEIDQ